MATWLNAGLETSPSGRMRWMDDMTVCCHPQPIAKRGRSHCPGWPGWVTRAFVIQALIT